MRHKCSIIKINSTQSFNFKQLSMALDFRIFEDLLALFYPNLCLACRETQPAKQDVVCTSCQFKLPKTDFHLEKDNDLTARFWGRLPLESGAALYHFVKGGRVQALLHQLKYNGKQEIGIKLGQRYGSQLRDSPFFKDIDVILPVPLHPKKELKRGYNQSALFAKGISDTMGKPWIKEGLIRKAFTETQTQKSRMERLENVMAVFEVNKTAGLAGKHILLVDDVITTGATLEACGLQLLSLPNTKLSIATIAIADF